MTSNQDKLNEFYKLKSKYESQISKEKTVIISNRKLSWKEKRNEFKNFKPKCINCKRPVGSLFSIIYDDEASTRNFKASCGDLVDPCNFLIEMTTNLDYLYTELIKIIEDELNELKNEVISYKNKILFGYSSSEETIDVFDKIKENINELSSFLENNLNNFNNVVDNKEKNAILVQLKEEIYNTYIVNIKNAMETFMKTNDTQYVRDAVDIYVNILTPKLKQLMGLQYRTCFVEFNEETNTYHLIQKKYSVLDIEMPNEVIVEKYEMGPGKLSKTPDEKDKLPKVKKTKKIVVDDDEGEHVINVPTIKITDIAEPIFRGDGSIVWRDPNYERIWLKFDQKYKNVLAKDIEWLKKSMNEYIKQDKEKKGYTFVPPNNLIFPPAKTEDGFDFGNELYNDIFNNLPTFQKNTLLTLPLDNDDNKGMKHAIHNIIATALNFRKF